MPGDVGLVAKLLDGVFRFFTDEAGYRQWQLDRQADALNAEFKEAIRAKDGPRADAALARLRELRETGA